VGFGTELLFIVALGLVVLGPKRLHIVLGHVARVKAGWNPEVGGIDPTTGASHATLATDRSNVGAVYTGLAIATNKEGQTFLYAADDGPNRRIDIFNDTFSLVKSFGDPAIPRGFSPYGIQTINGMRDWCWHDH